MFTKTAMPILSQFTFQRPKLLTTRQRSGSDKIPIAIAPASDTCGQLLGNITLSVVRLPLPLPLTDLFA